MGLWRNWPEIAQIHKYAMPDVVFYLSEILINTSIIIFFKVAWHILGFFLLWVFIALDTQTVVQRFIPCYFSQAGSSGCHIGGSGLEPVKIGGQISDFAPV